jgi:ABC-type dipeptide/oligopeptide/nickel transport system ATPase component
MIEMKVMGIALDTRTGSPIVVLHDLDNRKALPIWIGSAEASAIIRKIENLGVVRPMTHDLIVSIVEKVGYSLDRIEINNVENFKDSSKLLHPYSKSLVDALPKNGFKLTEGVQPLDEIDGCVYHENCPLKTDKCLKIKPELIEYNGAMIR